ncbi:hypothetical protein AMTR_s00062p00109550 [Amborella trichopoda]|uniref:CDP-diacylglycerol--glycerol-3-phosphate 3-phosphatidyltransferase n=1 Tax=Amborella trichopoda TaxID=13333 RepID=U5D1V7_AMBTC|nr:hypothetical protein AMTR_s00062p00109550 [Amborella trichopoda]
MAIRRSIKALLRNHNSRSLFLQPPASPLISLPPPFLHQFPLFSSNSSTVSSVSSNAFSFSLLFTSARTRFFTPLRKWVPLSGPLFLSAPPWKLSQSATPLYLRGELCKLRKRSVNVISERAFAAKLALVSGNSTGYVETLIDNKRLGSHVSYSESLLNPPNLISITRMVSGPVIGWMIINESYSMAFLGLAVAGASDWLDGYAARKMGISSVIGSYLDPLADKVLIACVALSMVKKDLLHSGLVGLVVLRDLALIGGSIYKRAESLDWQWRGLSDFINLQGTRVEKVEPLLISKLNTVLQLSLIAAALLQPEFGNDDTAFCITYLSLWHDVYPEKLNNMCREV